MFQLAYLRDPLFLLERRSFSSSTNLQLASGSRRSCSFGVMFEVCGSCVFGSGVSAYCLRFIRAKVHLPECRRYLIERNYHQHLDTSFPGESRAFFPARGPVAATHVLLVSSSVMTETDKSKLAFRLEFRAKNDQRWIPIIACHYHAWLLRAHGDVRPRVGGTLPKSQCQYCVAAARTKAGLLKEGWINNSPLHDSFTPSERKKIA